MIVDLCYTIGCAALKTSQYEIATTWLGRALAICELWSDESHANEQELRSKRLLIVHAYGKDILLSSMWTHRYSAFKSPSQYSRL